MHAYIAQGSVNCDARKGRDIVSFSAGLPDETLIRVWSEREQQHSAVISLGELRAWLTAEIAAGKFQPQGRDLVAVQ